MIVVLGNTGYLGSAVVRELISQGADVVGARSVADASRALATSDGSLLRLSVVVNCVGRYDADADEMARANVEEAERAARLAARHDSTLVHVSSSSVFDGIRKGTITEATDPRPRTAYGTSKLTGELRVRAISPGAIIVRPAKLFGGADPRRRLHSLIDHVRRGGSLPIPRTPGLWTNFVWLRSASEAVARVALDCDARHTSGTGRVSQAGTRHPNVLHLACPLQWTEFLATVSELCATRVRRASRPVELLASATAYSAWIVPVQGRFRHLDRLLEIWDQQRFSSEQPLIDVNSLHTGLSELAAR